MKCLLAALAFLGCLLSCPIARAQTAAGNLPEGFVLYEGQKGQYTIAIPREWTAYDQSQMLKEKGGRRRNE